ncbi:MAG: PLP-dependent aspartate aminotransferase family protein [Ignavibacteriales bacterium]|nr:PLP-dependent aspartate aminotransferase family protein [Ignavibacteriales bacterium]
MAATNAVLTLVKAGQRVVVSDNVYGGTHRLFTKVLAQLRHRASRFIDATRPGGASTPRPAASTCSGSRRRRTR